jgi:hypothetical protein
MDKKEYDYSLNSFIEKEYGFCGIQYAKEGV